MGTVGIAKAQIQRQRQPQFQRPTHRIVDALHEFRGSGKPRRSLPGCPQPHHQNIAVRCYAPISPDRCPPISRCNAQHACAMSAQIPAGDETLLFFQTVRCQRRIDPFPGVFGSHSVAIGRQIAKNHSICFHQHPISRDRLIPDGNYSCGAILVSKIRVRVIHAGVHHRHQHAPARQVQPQVAHLIHTGSSPSSVQRKEKPFWFFHELDLRELRQPLQLLLRQRNDGIFIQQPNHLHRLRLHRCQLPGIFHDHIPGVRLLVKSHIQVQGFFPLCRCCIQCQIQQVFQFLILQLLTLHYLTHIPCLYTFP